MMNLPYTYLLFHVPTNRYYYGVRFAVGCHPSDFWVSYFTSSKVIQRLINEYGTGPDVWQYSIHKTFASAAQAKIYENIFLKMNSVDSSKTWLNLCISGYAGMGTTGMKFEPRSKMIGTNNPRSKYFLAISPRGDITIDNCLTIFCKTHELNSNISMKVARNDYNCIRATTEGWFFRYLTKDKKFLVPSI